MRRSSVVKTASTVFVLALLVLLASAYVALVYHGDVTGGADAVIKIDFGTWIAGFSVALAALFLVLLVLFIVPVHAEQARTLPTILIACTSCEHDFETLDTGQRPLVATCPHCGQVNQWDEGATAAALPPAEAMAEPAIEAEAEPDAALSVAEPQMGAPRDPTHLILACGNCNTQFETPFTENRPLIVNCTNCGRRGILRASPSQEA